MDGGRHARHLEHDVHAQVVRVLFHHGRRLLGTHGVVRSHPLREREALVVDVGRDDPGRARRLADAHGEDADRSTARHQHGRTRNVRREGRVKRVAHRIVDSADVE